MDTTCSGHKGRRMSPVNTATTADDTSINSLTNDILISIADYLPKTSRALFAVALTAPASSFRERGWNNVQPNEASRAVVASVNSSLQYSSLIDGLYQERRHDGNCLPFMREHLRITSMFKSRIESQLKEYYSDDQWGILDFVDIEKSLSRLTDEDIGAVLVCINGKTYLKALKLTNCFNIVGHGLEPLRSSQIIQKIDMSLTRELAEEANISEESVLPIIREILRHDGNAFQRLQVPMGWRNSTYTFKAPSVALVKFFNEHEHIFNPHSMCCYFGFSGKRNKRAFVRSMGSKNSKFEWDQTDTCIECERSIFLPCNFCFRPICRKCDALALICRGCDAATCQSCRSKHSHSESMTLVRRCEDRSGIGCGSFCNRCRFQGCLQAGGCIECKGLVFDMLADEYDDLRAETNEQQETIERLEDETEAMQDEIEAMQDEMQELREQLENLRT